MSNYSKWVSNLKQGIEDHIISVIEPGEDDVSRDRAAKLTDERRMNLWIEVFTDSSRSTLCYEPYEFIGDKIVNMLVAKLTIRTFPGVQPEQMTAFVAHYASNEVQGAIMQNFTVTRNIGGFRKEETFLEAYMLKPLPETGLQLTSAVYADMYEAILGGISTAGDDIVDGLGLIYATRWFEHIFVKNITIEEKYGQGQASSILTGLFTRFEFYTGLVTGTTGDKKGNKGIILKSKVKTDPKSTRSWVEFKVYFSKPLVEFLKSLDDSLLSLSKKKDLPEPRVESKILSKFREGTSIASSEEDTLASAREVAAERALEYLDKKFGINDVWATILKNKLDIQAIEADPALYAAYNAVVSHLASKGYKEMLFKPITKHSREGNYQGIQLIGRSEDGEEEVFFTHLYREGNRYGIRKHAIKDFAMSLY